MKSSISWVKFPLLEIKNDIPSKQNPVMVVALQGVKEQLEHFSEFLVKIDPMTSLTLFRFSNHWAARAPGELRLLICTKK